MPSHALPRRVKVNEETVFAEAWTSGTELYVTDVDVSSIDQQNLDSDNNRPRRTFVHDKIRGLKSGSTFPCGFYLTAAPANAAEAAQAALDIYATIMKAALGGLSRGFAVGISGGTAAAPEFDSDPGLEIGDWLFCVDDTTGEGEFYRVETVGVAATFAHGLDRALHFTPDGGGADTAHAVIASYLHEPALNNHDDTDHTTLGWQVSGEGTEDVYEVRGCKPALSIENITAGEACKVSLENMVTTWDSAQAADAATTPEGKAPNVPGTGDDTYVRLIQVGSDIDSAANVDCRGAITTNIAVSHEAVSGPNGIEGVHGYVATGIGDGGPSLIVEYDNAYDTAWEAEVKYRLYVQVGTTAATAWAVYWDRLEFMEKPKRADEGGVTSHALSFRAQESTADTTGLTGQDLSKRRSPFIILRVA